MPLEPTSGSAGRGWISAPLSRLTPRARALVVVAATLAGAGYAAWKELHYRGTLQMTDIWAYVAIANGQTADVPQPFVSRQLGPRLAHAIATLLHRSTVQGFYLLAAVSILILVGVIFAQASRTRAPWWMLAAIAMAPMLPDTMLGLILPDLFYAALLAILLVLLDRELWIAAALWMLPLMLARESTSLTLLCLLIAAWKPLRWRGRLLAIAAAAAGSAIVHRLTLASPGNPQHLPQSLYILLKIPWNAAQNLFGVQLWNNINDACGTPVWQHAIHLGSIRAVGFCGVNPAAPRATLLALLTEFGLLPLLTVFVLWRSNPHPTPAPTQPLGFRTTLRFAAVYGTICFLLGPLLGTGINRLMGYGWPLFFVALPVWMGESPWLRSRRAVWAVPIFLALHVGLSWSYWRGGYLPEMLLAWAAAAVVLWFWSQGAQASSQTAIPASPEMGSGQLPRQA